MTLAVPGATGFVALAHGAAKHESESRRRTRATTGQVRSLARWDPCARPMTIPEAP
jgi:hypothetical protein